MPQNFVTIHNTNYKVITQLTIWRIRCVDRDEWRRTEVGRRLDGGKTNIRKRSNGNRTEVGWKFDKSQTDIRRNNETMERNKMDCDYDGLHQQPRCKVIHIHELYDDGMQKKKEEFFSSTSCFFFLLFSSSFFSSRTTTRATHYMTVSLKTHKSAQLKC